jgi:cellobiose phosphorylase
MAAETQKNLENCPEKAWFNRREFLASAGVLAAGSLVAGPLTSSWAGRHQASLGEWIDDDRGLPGYRYAGPLRFPESPRENDSAMLPDDPLFLLGNYRLTLFTHASGIYQILTGERAWGRMNQGDSAYSGANEASVEVAGQRHNLIGVDEPAALSATKRFGVGFARYDYALGPAIEVTRQLSVPPSLKPGEGASAFLVTVRLHNTGGEPLQLAYTEAVRARYQQIFSPWASEKNDVAWPAAPATTLRTNTVLISFATQPKRKMAFPPHGQMSQLEQFPPSLFVHSPHQATPVFAGSDSKGHAQAGVRWKGTLQPGEEHEIVFVIGYSREASPDAIEALAARLCPVAGSTGVGSAFAAAWRRAVPAFEHESDMGLRREMQWNAAMLETMATWREYYDETVVPQGTVYDYTWGMMASSRDLAQHALPLCHTNPALARSVLRFLMKRTVPDGEIKLNDEGFGWSSSGAQQTSDQQLFFFLLLAEYLRVTRDTTVLREQIEYYPRDCSGRDTGLAHVRQAFLFLRDRIGTGPHGIVRRWNSDWNDMFFFWPTTMPYNRMFEQGESHMNSAMAIAILGDLAEVLDAAREPSATEVAAAMREYRGELLTAFLRDLGDRAFPRRAWTSWNSALGEKEMWLEPQGFALLIPELGAERKQRLFEELKRRLLQGESMGARQIEVPVDQPGTPAGSRENGGFWYALNGPLILGVATFDPRAAGELMRRMTFANFARSYPDYWTGRWTASDSLDSSLRKTDGLSENMVWCAHAHAWPLYCWLRLAPAVRQPPSALPR